jgi:hypothetical protein
MDYGSGVASGRFLLAALLLSPSCRLTEVAVVTVRNETVSDLTVHVRLPGDEDFREDLTLESAQESTVLKYGESGEATPLPQLIDELRLVSGTCVGTLDAATVAELAERSTRARRWTLRVTPGLLRRSGCPP